MFILYPVTSLNSFHLPSVASHYTTFPSSSTCFCCLQASTQPASKTSFLLFLQLSGSHTMISTLFHAVTPACTLLCISLLIPPSSYTILPKYTKLFTYIWANCMLICFLLTSTHYFSLLQIHSEVMFSERVIPLLQYSL